jgi:uncharacterized protein YegP (UPF0339 family)
MDTVHFFTDDAGEWRWRRVSENGQIVAVSGEGYTDIDNARNIAISIFGDTVRLAYDEPDKPVPLTTAQGEEIPPEEVPPPA